MKRFSFSSPSLIGLDIQQDSVRLVQLKKTKRHYLAEHIAMRTLPSDVFREGKIKEWAMLSQVLTELVQTLGLQGSDTAIHLPANLVRMQQLQLPMGLSQADIEAEIYTHLQRDLPGMTDTLCLDFSLRPSVDAAYNAVFFAAARQEYVSQYIECVNAAGLKTKIVDVDTYALKRAACFALHLSPQETDVFAMVHVVNKVASLIIFNANEVIFHQHWDVLDKRDFSSQLKNRLQLCLATLQQAKVSKLIIGAANGYLDALANDFTPSWAFQLCYPNPFAAIPLAPNVDAHLVASQASDFLVACGSALREVPAW